MYQITDSIWGRAGTKFDGVMTVDSALEKAGLDWEVERSDLFLADGSLVGEKVANIRTDTGDLLGVVGENYKIVQNRFGFELMEPLLDRGLVKLIGGGEFRDGKDVWLQVDFNIEDPVVQEFVDTEGVRPTGLFTNGHGGDRGLGLFQTLIRVVCRNTFIAAMGYAQKQFRAAHTQNVHSRSIDGFDAIWGGIIESYRFTAMAYGDLRKRTLTNEEFDRHVLDVIAPMPKVDEIESADGRTLAAIERTVAKRQRIASAWDSGAGHSGDYSAFEAFSAVTEVMDHDDESFPLRSGTKAERQFYGSKFARAKEQVFSELLSIS
jgi:phage/plasmid-like protein (TIGR03299 family)